MNTENNTHTANTETTEAVPMGSPAARRALKVLVLGLALLIVLGVLLIGYGIYHKSNNPEWKLFSSNEPAKTVAQSLQPSHFLVPSPKEFGKLYLGDPGSCDIQNVTPNGSLLYVTTCNRIYVIDAATWAVLGTIEPGSKP